MTAQLTTAQILAAEQYAMEKLCTWIPSKFGDNLTRWDSAKKACRITQAGCKAGPTSPFSRIPFTNNGTPIDIIGGETSKFLLDFWGPLGKKWTPDFYVWKTVTGSDGPVCARGNSLLYRWCEFPASREGKDGWGSSGGGYNDVPPFKYTVRDNYKETCVIGKDYCDNRGVSYSDAYMNEDCYVPEWQKVSEFLASETLVRYGRRANG